jgi:hypothetical protein
MRDAPDESNRQVPNAGLLLAIAIAATFTVLRVALGISPNSDFDVLGYNVHHLFTGVLIISATAIPIATGVGGRRARTVLTILLGMGLGLVLDEWVYLIVTDGSNAAYLTRESFIGGIVLVALASVYAIVLSRR